jgi:hypothetical protein
MTDDVVSLTIPGDEAFARVAHLVLGGLAVRLDLTFEHLEDLNLALDGLLEHRDGEDTTITVRIGEEELLTSVGPFPRGHLEDELERETPDGLGLRRVLETVVDGFEVDERDGAEWIDLRKHVERVGTRG